jgi:plasmid stabilization system protein ParE
MTSIEWSSTFMKIALTRPTNVAKILYDGCAGLGSFPFLGRKGKLPGTRELVFSKLPYIVVYEVQGEVVNLIRIYHAAQDRQ